MLLWDERTPPIHFGRRHCPAPPPPPHTPSMSACMHKEHEKPHGRTAVSPAPHCRAHTRILPSLSSPHHTTRREEEKAALKPGKVSVAFSAGGGDMEGRAQGCCMQEMERRECITWGRFPLRGCSLGCAKRLLKGESQTVGRPANPAGESSPAVGFCSLGVFAVPHVLNGIRVTDGDG